MEKRKRGGQPCNKNAVGNRGGGAPYGNTNAQIHGLYLKIILTHDEQEYLSCSTSKYDCHYRLLDIKMYRLQIKIKHWKQSIDEDGFIHIKTKRVVRQWEKTDYTITTRLGSAYLLLKAELLLQDFMLK